MKTVDELMTGQRVMAVLRGLSVDRTVELAHAAWDIGIDCVEVTIQNAEAIEALARTVLEGRDRQKDVGAGTVTTVEAMLAATAVGAAFTVSPSLDPVLVAEHRRIGVPHLPGVATPTEVMQATHLGLTWLKAFPAASLSPSWFSAMTGPFPQVRFIATGGITAASAQDFLRAGVAVVGVGSALEDAESLAKLRAVTVGG